MSTEPQGPASAADAAQLVVAANHAAELARLGAQIEPPASLHGRRVLHTLGDDRAFIDGHLVAAGLRPLDGAALWIRLLLADNSAGIIFALRNGSPTGDAELLVAGDRGVLTRSLLRYAARWAFVICGQSRVSLHTRAADRQAGDYARRAGFRHEGRLRDYYGPDLDGLLWGMTRAKCPWLRPEQRGPLALSPAIPATVN